MKAAIVVALSVVCCAAGAAEKDRATRIHVDKSDRLMQVYAGKRQIASFPIGLGARPEGHKQQEGDRRTPEGRYILDCKKPESGYFKSIHISYPNAADRASAKQRKVSPGGCHDSWRTQSSSSARGAAAFSLPGLDLRLHRLVQCRYAKTVGCGEGADTDRDRALTASSTNIGISARIDCSIKHALLSVRVSTLPILSR